MFKDNESALDYMINLLRELVKTKPENPPGNEEKAAFVLKNALDKIGLNTTLDFVEAHRPNVIAVAHGESKGPKILLNGHLDVVPATAGWSMNPYDITIKNDKIYGRGTVDMFGGLVAMVTAVKHFLEQHKRFNGKILFTAVINEEAGGTGAKHLVSHGIDADFGFVAEPSNNKLFICERGVLWYRFKVHGKAAHGSLPHEGVNAIDVLLNLLSGIKQMKLEYSPHKFLGFHTVNIGKISGGRKVNIVADFAEAEVDIRTTPLTNHDMIKDKITAISSAISKLYDAKIENEIVLEALPFEIDTSTEFVKKTINAISKALGVPPKLDGMPGATDARFFIEAGIPMLIYGPGPIEKAHKDDEYVTIDSLLRTYKAYYSILEEFLL